jgi:hypothetical protein
MSPIEYEKKRIMENARNTKCPHKKLSIAIDDAMKEFKAISEVNEYLRKENEKLYKR